MCLYSDTFFISYQIITKHLELFQLPLHLKKTLSHVIYIKVTFNHTAWSNTNKMGKKRKYNLIVSLRVTKKKQYY